MKAKTRKLKTKLTALLLAVLMISAGVVYVPQFAKADDFDQGVPDRINFGKLDGLDIEWTVLEFDKNTRRALVVASVVWDTKSVQEFQRALYQVYPDPSKSGFVNWNNSYWRNWLNDSVYNNCFSDNDKKHIHKTTFSVAENQDSIMQYFHDAENKTESSVTEEQEKAMDIDIYYNQASSSDRIFFLSYEQYMKYKDKIPKSDSTYLLKTNSFYDMNRKAAVKGDKVSSIYNYTGGIRPAMWIYLNGLYDDADKSTNSAGWTEAAAAAAAKVYPHRKYKNNATSDSRTVGNKIVLPNDAVCELDFGEKVPITLELDYLNWSEKKYTARYESSDTSIFTIDDKCNVVAGNTIGSATLRVEMMKDNGITYTMECKINVGHDLISDTDDTDVQ